jgi:steroid 5-alpha reductase family enzyme
LDALLSAAGFAALVVFVYMTTWFVVAMVSGRNDIADVAWGLGFVVVAWALVIRQGDPGARLLLIAGLHTAWGIRLAIHIHTRNRGRGEDFRYENWRKQWGRWFVPRTYLQVFLLQGFFMVLICAPAVAAAAAPEAPVGPFAILGTAVWLFGLVFEAIGDAQLLAFKRDPANKGAIMNRGLWRYTRHPNYFGEVVLWWGVWLVALPVELGWLAIVGPLTITVLLLRVSGIPMLEKKYEGRADWEAYKARTSAFVPLPPKSADEADA